MSFETAGLGYFGNVWVKMNYIPKAGGTFGGHTHGFDHVSLLVRGKVRVEIEGFEPKEFTAPTFIVIKKEYNHNFIALEDDSLWYCVFALRNVDGEVMDIYSDANSPYATAPNNTDKLINT